MNITLKARHFYYITSILKNLPLDTYFYLIKDIKENSVGVDDEDDVTISANAQQIEQIYSMLSSRPEGEVNMINTEMSNALMEQIMPLVMIGNDEAINVAGKIQVIRETNWGRTDNAISQGKSFLHPDVDQG